MSAEKPSWNWQSVESSQIKRIGHDANTRTCYIEFIRGGVYAYKNFESEKFDLFLKAESHGKFLGVAIKPIHEFRRITDEEEFAAITGRCIHDLKNEGDCGRPECKTCHPNK